MGFFHLRKDKNTLELFSLPISPLWSVPVQPFDVMSGQECDFSRNSEGTLGEPALRRPQRILCVQGSSVFCSLTAVIPRAGIPPSQTSLGLVPLSFVLLHEQIFFKSSSLGCCRRDQDLETQPFFLLEVVFYLDG